MQIQRADSDALEVNSLPDSSKLIINHESKQVFALNATAGAAWDACGISGDLEDIATEMEQSLDAPVPKDMVLEAVHQLQEQNLVNVKGLQPTRRAFLSAMSAVALPLVVSLTMAEQQAHASVARSVMSLPSRDEHKIPKGPLPIRRGPSGLHFE